MQIVASLFSWVIWALVGPAIARSFNLVRTPRQMAAPHQNTIRAIFAKFVFASSLRRIPIHGFPPWSFLVTLAAMLELHFAHRRDTFHHKFHHSLFAYASWCSTSS